MRMHSEQPCRPTMKIGIMQPYFFPYIGYFQLINAVDQWVVFDIVQYIERGWMNRNRILSPNLEKEWCYIVVPTLNHERDRVISEVRVDGASGWQNTILGQLSYYRKIRAPFFDSVSEFVSDSINNYVETITDLNVLTLKSVCGYLGVEFNYRNCSAMAYDFSSVNGPGDWAFEIARQSGADEYLNPPGGIGLFDRDKFSRAGIGLSFLKPREITYRQSRRTFVPWLSIIDVMMFNSKDEVRKMLTEYDLI